MKKRECLVEVADLEAVAHIGEDLVLYIDGEDEIIPTTLCVQANFDTRQFDPVKPMSAYLNLNSYEPIQDADTQISYRQRIDDQMNPTVIAAMLIDFNRKLLQKLESNGCLNNDYQGWVPGG
jgi:hypothetical protein